MACLNMCPLRPCKKPLSPMCTVQMSDTKDSPVPIPLLAAALGAETRTVMLAYGNHLQPVMEKVVSAPEIHARFSIGHKNLILNVFSFKPK